MSSKIITFTPNEWSIIEHRLCMADTLAEVLCDTYDHFELKDVESKAEALYEQLKGMNPLYVEELDEVQIEILKDCVEGSTYFADSDEAVGTGEITKGKFMSDIKSANSIERKLKAAGILATFPNY